MCVCVCVCVCVVFANFFITFSPIRRTACARAQFSGCSSTTNNHSETGQMVVCYQNITLGALSSRIAFSLLVGVLFKKFGIFLNKPCMFLIAGRNCSSRLTYIRPIAGIALVAIYSNIVESNGGWLRNNRYLSISRYSSWAFHSSHIWTQAHPQSVAYPGFFSGGGGVQQIQLRTEGRQIGDLGAVAP
jgi:hypothetical protein